MNKSGFRRRVSAIMRSSPRAFQPVTTVSSTSGIRR
jgi:hypothetical protein